MKGDFDEIMHCLRYEYNLGPTGHCSECAEYESFTHHDPEIRINFWQYTMVEHGKLAIYLPFYLEGTDIVVASNMV